MRFRNSFIFCLLFLVQKVSSTGDSLTLAQNSGPERSDTVYVALSEQSLEIHQRPSPLLQRFKTKQKKNKKVIAALLAFPFPFGIVGLHRIYLGCAPYVPIAYIGSLGGVFGILPFIDFCVLLLDKDIDRYINNKKIFMWVN